MADFNSYSLDTVPEAGRETLETVQKAYGFVPNLIGTMVESPALARAYLEIGKTFGESSLSPTEQQVVLLTVSRFNECEYCVAAHSTVATLGDVPASIVDALRDDRPLDDPRLESLRRFTLQVLERRGWAGEDAVEAFLGAGFNRAQLLDVVLGVAMKTLSNYTNHIAKPKLDAAFQAAEWRAPAPKVA